ncbi:MAG TPA: hypothetical protein VKB96_00935, partial [Gammaproteobacteria bacterium]|nr:hypothetical protein [Gammaproteobacteria bacterium]
SVSGPLKRPKVEARLTGAGLQYQTFQLQSLNLGAYVDLSGEAQSRLTVALENGQVGNIALNKFSLNGEGDLAAHTFNLTARTSTGDADVALTGALEHLWQPDMLWRFQLYKARLKYPQLAAWQLPSPTTGMINAERAELSRGCWRSGEAKLCLQGERSTAGWHSTVEVKNLAFTYFAPLLPPGTRLYGKLSAQGEFEQPVNDLMSGTMHVMTSAGCLASVVAGVGTQAGPVATPAVACQGSTLLDFRPSDIDFEMGERGMHLAAALRLAGAGGVHVEAGVPQGTRSLTKRPLSGQITTNIPDLSFLAQLAPNMGRLKGRLNGDLRLAGTLKTPKIFGNLALIGGSIVLNGPGIILDGLRA